MEWDGGRTARLSEIGSSVSVPLGLPWLDAESVPSYSPGLPRSGYPGTGIAQDPVPQRGFIRSPLDARRNSIVGDHSRRSSGNSHRNTESSSRSDRCGIEGPTDSTPSGLTVSFRRATQGSRCAATLGYVMEPLRGSPDGP